MSRLHRLAIQIDSKECKLKFGRLKGWRRCRGGRGSKSWRYFSLNSSHSGQWVSYSS